MTTIDETLHDGRPDSQLTSEEIIARNLRVVDSHFHNENPDDVEKAVALYTDTITWEAPSRGVVMKDSTAVLEAYRGIFRTLAVRKLVPLRRFATEQFVFDDQLAHMVVVGDPGGMPNMPFPEGTEISARIAHCFEMRDGLIEREIAYELWREVGSTVDADDIPDDAVAVVFPDPVSGHH